MSSETVADHREAHDVAEGVREDRWNDRAWRQGDIITGGVLPVRMYRYAAIQPNNVVYPSWNTVVSGQSPRHCNIATHRHP
jgi:hypothetical protein